MNLIHLAGPRGILCLSGLLLVSTLPLHATSSRASESQPTGSIEVRLREAGCSTESYHSPALAEVRTVLSSPDRVPSVDATRRALELAYGEAVTQTSALVDYIWIKVDGHWLLWCVNGATLEVDFGLAGTAVVKVREPMPLPQS